MEPRAFDIVLFGATGTTGQLAARYLATHAPPGLRVALAGRDASMLEALQGSLGPAAQGWARLVADCGDAESLERLARQARVVATTVGPYARLGLPLVEVCARQGTHYADITGEVGFMRQSIDRYDAEARRTGARIVHGCGFDSIPSDLGVFMLYEHLRRAGHSGRLKRVTLVVESMVGGIAHGTLASILDTQERLARDRNLRRLVADPYALSPEREREPALGDEHDLAWPAFDTWLGRWTMPFVMAPTNTRVVRRTNALLGYAYGRAFRYREVAEVPHGARGLMQLVVALGSRLFVTVLRWEPVRRLMAKRLAKFSEKSAIRELKQGQFQLRLEAESEEGVRLSAHIAAPVEPGRGGTSRMLCETALGLALDADRLPERSGVLTPAAGMGLVLVERLRATGMSFKVLAAEVPATRRAQVGTPELGLEEGAVPTP